MCFVTVFVYLRYDLSYLEFNVIIGFDISQPIISYKVAKAIHIADSSIIISYLCQHKRKKGEKYLVSC